MLNAERTRNITGSTINGKYRAGSSILDRSKLPWFITLLICVKILSSVSTFLLADVTGPLTTDIHYPPTGIFGRWSPSLQTLMLLQLCSGLIFSIVQRPLSTGSKVALWEWIRIIRHAIVSVVFLMMWISGIQLSGPFRTIFVSAHYDYTLAAIFTAFFVVKSGPRLRGAVLFVASIIVLLLFDDASDSHQNSHTTAKSVEDEPDFMSKRSVGILTLALSLVLKLGFNAFAKTLAVDLGGLKRLHALSTLVSGIILFFMVLIDLIAGADLVPLRSNIVSLLFIVLFGFVSTFYVDTICLKRMEAAKVARLGSAGSQLSALLISLVWATHDVPTVASLVAFTLVCLGTFSLTSDSQNQPSGGGSFVGYSSDGLPLFSFSNQATSEGISLWKDIAAWFMSLHKQIQEDSTSRKIFYFFLINLTFTCVEFLCGTLSNSLGLISDGFHMLFDTIALLIGLCASVMCRWSPTPLFPCGYTKISIISGFINTLFLLVVAVVLFVEAGQRLFDPPTLLETHRLLPVSCLGLLVNICGIFAFRNSTGVDNPSYSHHRHNNANVKGVFLHILADTMGSVGVIISSFVVHQWGLLIVDPICSIIVAALVVISVLPLLKDTGRILLLTIPIGLERNIQQVLLQILAMDGVCGYTIPRFWTHSMDVFTGSLHVQVQDDTNEQAIIRQVTSLFSAIGFSHFVVQVEKNAFISNKNKNSIEIEDESKIGGDSFKKAEISNSGSGDIGQFETNNRVMTIANSNSTANPYKHEVALV